MEYKDPGRYIPSTYLLYSWGSLSGVPSRVPLFKGLVVSLPGSGGLCKSLSRGVL